MSDGSTAAPLATPSLRRRVTVVVLLLVAVMLAVLAVVTDRVLADRLDSQLRQRLVDRASVAAVLVDQVDGRDLARRLEGDGVSVVVTDPDGETYAEGPLAGGAVSGPAARTAPSEGPQVPQEPQPAGPGPRAPAPEPQPEPEVVQSGSQLSVTRDLDDGTRVVVLADAGDIATTMGQVRLALLFAGLLVLVAAAAAVPLVVRRALRPLDRITDAAQSISDGDRERRLRPTRPGTELGRTATAFDVMLDEITGAEQRATGSEARLREFLFDAAHELRTPLTGVQAAAERVLRDDPDRAERERVLLTLVRESRRAGRLVEDMLLVARLDGDLGLARERLDLTEVAREVVAAREALHPGVTATVTSDGPASVVGDRDRLTQLVGNLVDNAVHAAGERAVVALRVTHDDATVVLGVSDDGPGVPTEQRERIFERLVRLDASRSARTGGVGLGLPIARGLARAHGGDVRCVAPTSGTGARFEVRLPAVDSGAEAHREALRDQAAHRPGLAQPAERSRGGEGPVRA